MMRSNKTLVMVCIAAVMGALGGAVLTDPTVEAQTAQEAGYFSVGPQMQSSSVQGPACITAVTAGFHGDIQRPGTSSRGVAISGSSAGGRATRLNLGGPFYVPTDATLVVRTGAASGFKSSECRGLPGF